MKHGIVDGPINVSTARNQICPESVTFRKVCPFLFVVSDYDKLLMQRNME